MLRTSALIDLLAQGRDSADLCNQGLKERLFADQMITDAQEVGIVGKHKSNVGTFIPWRDLH